MGNARQHVAVLALLLTGLLLAGCHSAQVAHPLTANLAGNDPDSQLEFWHTLASRPLTSNDEAFHGLLLYMDRADGAKDYAGRVSLLRSRHMLPNDFDRPAGEAVHRGVLAVAMVGALQIKGGLVMHLTGRTERYAVRELEFMELYPRSSENQTFSGREFLGIVGKMEDYQRVNPVHSPAAMMPGEVAQAQGSDHAGSAAPAQTQPAHR